MHDIAHGINGNVLTVRDTVHGTGLNVFTVHDTVHGITVAATGPGVVSRVRLARRPSACRAGVRGEGRRDAAL